MVATVVVAEDHVPPAVVLLRVVVPPIHTEVVPVIAAGNAETVTVAVMLQPVTADTNVITDVPGATPVTNPFILTVAIPSADEDQVPAVVLLN